VLELGDAVVFPDVFDQGFDVAADCVEIGVTRTEYTGVLTFCIIAMALYDEAIGNLEDSLVTIVTLDDFPCFAGGEVQVVLAVWAVWRGVGRDAC
jgi:hypothetical protein